ncbi:MAG: hypothetical protein WKG01_29230, partial [Kofleriaceae bacterium]
MLNALGCKQDPTRSIVEQLPPLPTERPIVLPVSDLGRHDKGLVLPLVLGPGRTYFASRTSLIGSPERFTWRGTLGTHGVVVITSHGATLTGTIFNGEQVYRIEKAPGGGGHIRLLPPQTRKIHETDSPPKHGSKPDEKTEVGRIQLLVAYTKAAKEGCGALEVHGDEPEPEDAIVGLIHHSVALTNEVAAFTGVNTGFEVAYTYETDFNESSGIEEALDAFVSTTDTRMQEVHTLRSVKKADIAILMISDPRNTS